MRFLFRTKKFSEPPRTAVFTTTFVIKDGSPIIYVSHDLDGDWQFLSTEIFKGGYTEDQKLKMGAIVGLGEIIELDKSVLRVADLPLGYCATRSSKRDKWVIARIEYSEEEIRDFGYYCSECGIYHSDIPMAYGADAPYQYFSMPEEEREKRCVINDDQCIIDDKQYFIRGGIELQVQDKPDNFRWNVWVEISEQDFDRISELWEDENRILESPYHGKIASILSLYPQTIDLSVLVITQPVGFIPKIELLESDHPLFLEQESGITLDRVKGFAEMLLHQH